VLITFIYENVFLQLASIVPSLAILLVSLGTSIFESNPVTVALPLLAAIPLVVVLNRRLFHGLMSFGVRRLLKQELPAAYFLPTRSTIRYLFAFLLPRVLNGVG